MTHFLTRALGWDRTQAPDRSPSSRERSDRERRRALSPGVERLEPVCLLAADPVLAWNAVALDAVAIDHSIATPAQPGPTRSARALAIVHVAIADALNAIDRQFTPYLVRGRAPRAASIDAAVARAGHDTLVALYPDQAPTLDAALRASLEEIPDGRSENLGVAVGRFVARRVLHDRRRDGSELVVAYDEPEAPGTFQTFTGEPAALTPGWGDVDPFVATDISRFRAPPPPSLTSQEYAAAYHEVLTLGGDGVTTPTLRTQEQTEIGIFWGYDGTPGLGTPPRLYNQIARLIAEQQGNTPSQNARLFALVNVAMADAGCASWESKYVYDFWRPIRGIRQVGSAGPLDDGNPATTADPDWTPLGAPCTNCPPDRANFTPPFPAYVSGHATFGAALFRTLARFYGRDDVAFTFTSDEYNGLSRDVDGTVRPLRPRSFTSFSQAAEENGQSRIYLGIHWSFDKEQGIAQGNAIADEVFDHAFRPLTHPRAAQGARLS